MRLAAKHIKVTVTWLVWVNLHMEGGGVRVAQDGALRVLLTALTIVDPVRREFKRRQSFVGLGKRRLVGCLMVDDEAKQLPAKIYVVKGA